MEGALWTLRLLCIEIGRHQHIYDICWWRSGGFDEESTETIDERHRRYRGRSEGRQ
jgi:hypothetical protein